MHPRSPKLLENIRDAAQFICETTAGQGLADYSAIRLLRHAVERNFEIIGEAANAGAIAGAVSHHLPGYLPNATLTNSLV